MRQIHIFFKISNAQWCSFPRFVRFVNWTLNVKLFCFEFCTFSRWYNTGVISGSQMSSQLLQNTEIIKQTDFGKSEEKTDLSRIYSAVLLIQSGWNKDRIWINIFLEKIFIKCLLWSKVFSTLSQFDPEFIQICDKNNGIMIKLR